MFVEKYTKVGHAIEFNARRYKRNTKRVVKEGNFGKIYIFEDHLSNKIAVKRIKKKPSEGLRFRQELEAISKLEPHNTSSIIIIKIPSMKKFIFTWNCVKVTCLNF